jgi:hypothetical protein
LLSGYAVTDYYAQGLTFKDDRWLVHLTPPPGGKFARASIVVIISRYRSWDSVHLLDRLWDSAAQREVAIDKFTKTLTMTPALEHELARLQALAASLPAAATADTGHATAAHPAPQLTTPSPLHAAPTQPAAAAAGPGHGPALSK